MGTRGPTDPYPLSPGQWQLPGQPQQNLPNDDTPGLDTNGFSMTETAAGILRRQIPFWDDPPATLDPSNAQFSPWDVVVLSGQRLPGVCTVTGRRGKRFDVKKSKGSDFANITKQGYELAEIKVVERIWTPQQLHALWLMMPMLEAAAQKTPDGTLRALEVRHPVLDLRDVNAVLIKSIGFLQRSSVLGVWEQELELIEYKPPKAGATATAKGTTMYNVQTQTNQRFTKGPVTPKPPFTDTGPNGGRGN